VDLKGVNELVRQARKVQAKQLQGYVANPLVFTPTSQVDSLPIIIDKLRNEEEIEVKPKVRSRDEPKKARLK